MILDNKRCERRWPRRGAKDRIRNNQNSDPPRGGLQQERERVALWLLRVAKKLLRLTLAALLAEEGGALGQSSGHCYVAAMETTTAPTTQGTIFMLSFVIFIMVFVMAILLRFIFRLQRQIVELKEVVMNIRQALRGLKRSMARLADPIWGLL